MNEMRETFAKWEQAAAKVLAESKPPSRTTGLDRQVGGTHYQDMAIQPAEFCLANMSIDEIRGAMRWNIQKYIWRKKGGVEDLKKAAHYLEMWISAEMDDEHRAPAD